MKMSLSCEFKSCLFLSVLFFLKVLLNVSSSQTLKRLLETPCLMTNWSHFLLIQKVLKRCSWIKSHFVMIESRYGSGYHMIWMFHLNQCNTQYYIFCVVCRNINWKKWFLFKIFNEFLIICFITIRTWLFQTRSPETLVQSRRLLLSHVQVHVTVIILLFKTLPSLWLW